MTERSPRLMVHQIRRHQAPPGVVNLMRTTCKDPQV